VKAHHKLLIALLCVAVACIAFTPLATVAQEPHPVPTAAQMAADPMVSAAVEQAWTDSQAGDKDNRHEEGGWIVQNTATGALSVVRWPAGGRSSITPSARPAIPCHRVVGHFHTHPNPETDEDGKKWEQGPSDADNNFANNTGLPGLIRNAAGTETYGPATADPEKNPHTPLEGATIPDVPDTNQPPNQTLTTTVPINYCAPMATINILHYWDVVMEDPNAIGVTAGLVPETAAEYLGYFMNTNDTGSPDRPKMPHAGTYDMDMMPGTLEFVRWDMLNNFPVILDPNSPALPAGKSGYNWSIFTHYEFMVSGDDAFDILQAEIDEGRPLVASFVYWNPQDMDISVYAPGSDEIVMHVFAWGEPTGGSEDPLEEWNGQEGYEGIGHAVTVVGYVLGWDANDEGPLDYVIVHDNWASTPSYMAIPWAFWNSLTVVSPVLIP
jgi:hypothetical protein